MDENKNILNELNKRQKPEVPQGFFENFYDELMAKIAEQESGLDAFQKTTKPDVPADFFENFAKNINQQTNEHQPTEQAKPTRIINLRIVGIVTAVAACLLVMFQIVSTNKEAPTDCCSGDVALNTYSEDELLAYLDEDDIINYMVEEEIEFSNTEATLEETTNNTPNEDSSSEELEELNDEDILYYFEDDLDDINLDDLDL